FGKLHSFHVDLGDQRTSGVNHAEAAVFAGLANFGGDAVGAVNDALAVGDFVHGIDKNGAFALEFFDHKSVVNDLLAHVDGRAKGLKRDADDIDGANHPGADSAARQQEDALLAFVFVAVVFPNV